MFKYICQILPAKVMDAGVLPGRKHNNIVIRYVRHADIDYQKWDACIASAVNRLPYAQSWYLDTATDAHWDAVVLDDYLAVMPVPYTARWIFRKAYQPFFTQQLGWFFADVTHAAYLEDAVDLVARHWKQYRLHLNTQNHLPQASPHTLRITHHVDLHADYTTLRKQYGSQTLRNLKRADAFALKVVSLHDPDVLLQMRRKYLAHVIAASRQKETDTRRLGRIMQQALARGQGQLLAVQDAAQQIQAACFLLQDDHTLIYISAVSSEEGKDMHAMTMLIDHIFQVHAGSGKCFDFEGSMVEGIARYYKNFGGVEKWFPVISNA